MNNEINLSEWKLCNKCVNGFVGKSFFKYMHLDIIARVYFESGKNEYHWHATNSNPMLDEKGDHETFYGAIHAAIIAVKRINSSTPTIKTNVLKWEIEGKNSYGAKHNGIYASIRLNQDKYCYYFINGIGENAVDGTISCGLQKAASFVETIVLELDKNTTGENNE